MKKVRKLASTCMSCLFFGLLPSISYALGLGEIHLHSHLNEPLDAEIGIEDIKGVEPSDIITTIADPSAFTKAGLEPSGWLNHIRFQVTSKSTGKLIIQLSTQQPVKDPFADLLIQVTWPGGKIIKEYTILLDPPKVVSNQPKVALATMLSEKTLTPVGHFNKTIQAPGKVAQTVKPNTKSTRISAYGGSLQFGEKYGPVHDQTLWSIAKRLVENSHFTVYQGVVAIADKNQHAFHQGNINYIKQGAMLTLPTQQELSHYTEQSAKHFVENQTQNIQQAPIYVAQNEIEPRHKKAKSHVDEEPSKALRLVAPIAQDETISKKKTIQSAEGTNSGPQNKDDSRQYVSQRLSLIEEAIDTLKRSNDDISQKNQHLQNQNESLVKLLALKEDEINHLKQASEQKTPLNEAPHPQEMAMKANEGPKSYAVAIPDAFEKRKSENSPHQKHATFEQPSEYQLNKIEESNNKEEPTATNTHLTPDTTHSHEMTQYEKSSDAMKRDIIYLVFIFLLCCSILGWLWFSRHRLRMVFEWYKKGLNYIYRYKPKINDIQIQPELVTADAQVNYGLHFDLEKALDAVTNEENKYIKPQGSGAVNNTLTKQEQENLHKKSMASLEDAEIYIAYERYQQAEKILQEILKDDVGAHDSSYWEALLKLLEMYVLTENYEAYAKWYSTVPKDLKELSPKVWSKIILLQEKVDGEKTIQLPSLSKEHIKTAGDTHLELAKHHLVDMEEKQEPLAPQAEKLSLVNEADEFDSQLSLAKAYMEVGDIESARELLIKILPTGTEKQQQNAQILLDELNKK